MNTTYKATVNEEHEFEVNQKHLSDLDAVLTKNNEYHILEQNTSYSAQVIHSDFAKKEYQVQVNNNVYTVAISDEIDVRIQEMGLTVGGSKKQNNLISPMPGLIIDVQVTVGQEVNEGDTLVILSAMKMENSFVSDISGIIKAVHVSKDDAVDKGQLLVEFEEQN